MLIIEIFILRGGMYIMRALLLVLLLFPILGYAQTVNQVAVDKAEGGRINNITLKGAGFGNKSVPIFYDMADKALEKGVVNNFFTLFDASKQITQKETLQSLESPWSNVSGEIFVQSDPVYARSPSSGHYYHGLSVKANLQNPRIHSRTGTPQESKKVYISWWFKQQNETRNYFQIELSNIDAGFNPKEGDEFQVDAGPHWSGVTTIYGRVVGYYPDTKIFHANYYGQYNANRLTGNRLTLSTGGKGATLAVVTRGPGSNKYLRVWESDGTDGTFRSSWTNTEIYQADFRVVQRSNVVPREWNHMEYFADQEKKYIKTKVNGVVDVEGYYTLASDISGHSPTIGLIGQDSTQTEMHQKIWMDDIYLDGSFKRIVLGNAPKYSDVTHEEIQFFKSWTDTEIKFSPYYGALDRRSPAYIYIYSEDDVPNSEGIPFESPPKMEN